METQSIETYHMEIHHSDGRVTPIIDLERPADELITKIANFGATLEEKCQGVNKNLRTELLRQTAVDIQTIKSKPIPLSGIIHSLHNFASRMSTPRNTGSINALRNNIENLTFALFFGKDSALKDDEEVKRSVHELHLHELELSK